MNAENRPPKFYWSITEGAFNCLIDEDRTMAFESAIRNAIREGDVVVDMGSGTGILALFAAKAGASKVYAVEYDANNPSTLSNVFQSNGCADRIQIIQGNVCDLALPEAVDVIVGEMIATGLIEEKHVQANNNILRSAKNGVRVVLAGYDCNADLVWQNNKFYGLNLDVIRYEYPDESKLLSIPRTRPHTYASVNFLKPVENLFVNADVILTIISAGTINGLRISGQILFGDGSSFGSSFACNYPIILPLIETAVAPGDKFRVRLKYELCGGFRGLTYAVDRARP
jgi:predicted RNA methylase